MNKLPAVFKKGYYFLFKNFEMSSTLFVTFDNEKGGTVTAGNVCFIFQILKPETLLVNLEIFKF